MSDAPYCSETVVILNNLGAQLSADGQHHQALIPLTQANQLLPDNPTIIANLSASLNALERYSESLALCTHALTLGPVPAAIHNNLANALRGVGRQAESLPHYRSALDELPQNCQVLMNMGNAAMELGLIDQAEDAYRQAIDLEPHNGYHHRNLAFVHRYQDGDAHLRMMEQMLATLGQTQDQHAMELHFAVGKAYDDLGRYADAFHHFDRGNRLKRATIDYSDHSTETLFSGIAKSMPATFFDAFKNQGEPSAAPIFIVGMPRSGTTLVEQVLSCIPEVAALGERTDFQRLVKEMGPFPHLQLADLGRAYMAGVNVPTTHRPIDKMPSNFIHAGLIHLALPNARIIHVRRNPVDTCLSCYSLLFTGEQLFSYDLTELGRYYRHYQRLMDHWRQVLPATAFLEVEYETLVADFAAQSRRIVDFCQLPWTEDCLSFYRSNRPITTSSAMQVRQPVYQSSVGRSTHYAPYLGPLLKALRDPA